MVFQRFKFDPAFFTQVLWIEQPQLLAACQAVIALAFERLVFLATHLVDCFVEVFAEVKAVMHDLCLRGVGLHRVGKRRPHVDGHRFDRSLRDAMDAMDAVPIQTNQRGSDFDVAASLMNSNRKGLEQQGESRMFACPGNRDGSNTACRAVGSWSARSQAVSRPNNTR